MRARNIGISVFLLLLPFVSIAWSAEKLPASITDQDFWKMVTDFSEPGGPFRSDDYVSNELGFHSLLPELVQDRDPGGVYLGVGPEQNFTYIAALKPRIAFVFDIRRQNMIEHLVYKALFELSPDRADFLSRLLSRARPMDIDKDASIDALLDAFRDSPPMMGLWEENERAVKSQLMRRHGFMLSQEDEDSIDSVFTAFYIAGTRLTYLGPRAVRSAMPTFDQMMRDSDDQEVRRGFLASEENFATVRQLQKNNLIIPIVGDFGGPSAIRAVGAYLKDHDATVTAFYTSNVEQYLFFTDAWTRFYESVSKLPVDAHSVIIRPLLKREDGSYASSPRIDIRTPLLWDYKLFGIEDLVDAYNGGKILSYYDLLETTN